MNIPDTVTWGHVLMALAALAALGAVWYGLAFLRYGNAGRGTPLYARRRDARRGAILAAVAALVFAAVGCLTPLCTMAIA
jgi:hypothetical protein